MADKKSWIHKYAEGRTADDRVVSFSACSEDIPKICEALALMGRVELPVTKKVNVSHGSHGRYSRYDIDQHEYGGGGPGYIEVLEIKNPPDSRCGIVVHHYTNHGGSDFFEFDSVENAKRAWKVCWNASDRFEKIRSQQGFLRAVCCSHWTPWFYAVGEQMVEGDLVFMEIDREDIEFRFGKKYFVWDGETVPAIKTCMGAYRTAQGSRCGVCNRIGSMVTAFWHDGTFWKSNEGYRVPKPRMIEEGDLWILETMDKFRELLTGSTKEFSISFLDGSKFVGKWSPSNRKAHHAEGSYYGKINLKGGEIKEGQFDFKPTAEMPNIEARLEKWAKDGGFEIEKVEITRIGKTLSGKKKWSGVYPPCQ